MGTIKGGALSIDSNTKTQIEQALNNADKSDKDLVVRIKSTKNGTIEVLIDRGARGNIFSRNVSKAALQKKSDNNRAAAMLWLRQYASEGASGAKISQDSINTALNTPLMKREVATVEKARLLLAQGNIIDQARNAPHDNLGQITRNTALYLKSGNAGVRLLKEHLAALDIVNSNDAETLLQLSQMLGHPQLKDPAATELRNVVAQAWQETGQNLVRNGVESPLNTMLGNADNLGDVESLKNSLQDEARGKKIPLGSYNLVQNRFAQLTGIQKARDIIADKNVPDKKQAVVEALQNIKFSKRTNRDTKLRTAAQESALIYLENPQPALPDTDALATYFSRNLPVENEAKFKHQFAEELQAMVETGDLTIDVLERMNEQLIIFNAPNTGSHEEQLAQLAMSLAAPPKAAPAKTPPERTVPKGAAPPEIPPRKTPEVSRSKAVENEKRFNELRNLTEQRLMNIEYVEVKDRRFRDIRSPKRSNVPVVPSRTTSSAQQEDKIHANYMPFAEKKTAIATQYPAKNPKSRGMFWRMAVQQQTQMVVDLTQDKEKLSHYYPDKPDEPIHYDGMQVTLLNSTNNTHTYKVVDTETNEIHTVKRYHYKDWVDHGAASAEGLMDLTTLLNKPDLESVTVHCRAGVGRTATVFSAAVLQNKIRTGELTAANKDQVIDDVILDMRTARGGSAVQTPSQRLLLSNLVDMMLEKSSRP